MANLTDIQINPGNPRQLRSTQCRYIKTAVSVLHVINGLHPKEGGPARVVVQLTDALSKLSDMDVAVLTQRIYGDPVFKSKDTNVRLHLCESRFKEVILLGLPLRAELARVQSQTPPSLIHSHGLWMPSNHWTAASARRHSTPLVIQPHGTLEPWALNHKAGKKQLAMGLFQRRDLQSAQLLIASSRTEAESVRTLGFRQPIAIIPSGVHIDSSSANAFRHMTFAKPQQERTVLFLSRIHPVKGLINLVNAWARLRPDGWRLRIAGPDEGQHWEQVLLEAKKLGIADQIDYLGEVEGEQKETAFRSADLFVLPTLSENFGVVVAEALAYGLPVITTKGAPWADLEEHGCGWWISIGVQPLQDALRSAMHLTDTERRAMGDRGRTYAQRFDWADVARRTADVYAWLLKRGSQPACVELW